MKDLNIHKRVTVIVDAFLHDSKLPPENHKLAKEGVDSFVRIVRDRMVEFVKEWSSTMSQIKVNVKSNISDIEDTSAGMDDGDVSGIKVECPYCTCDALIRMEATRGQKNYHNPDELYFREVSGYASLNEARWQAYMCGVCKQVVILDEDAIDSL